MKAEWCIGGRSFATQSEVVGYSQSIAAKYDIGDELDPGDTAFMHDVLLRHPRAEQKIGCGVDTITITRLEEYGWRHKVFLIMRLDGTTTDFSWRKCLRVKPISHESYVMEAFRRVVASDVARFKRWYFEKYGNDDGDVRCALTGQWVSYAYSHVDHVKPFRILVGEFLSEMGLSFEDVELIGFSDGQTVKLPRDSSLAGKWRQWHKRHSELRI